MLVLTLVVVNIIITLNVLGKTAVNQVESKIDITVSFHSGTAEQVLGEVRSYLGSMPQVTGIETISAEAALSAFQEQHKDDAQILRSLEEIGENPFGPKLIVSARSPADYSFILEALENPAFADYIENKNFVDHEALIARINNITNRLKEFGVVLAAIFAIITILIIFNTIRVAIYTHREEIGIMKLVGASNWFVRAPFLLEAVIYSVLAVGITALITFPVLTIVEPSVGRFFDGVEIGLLDFFKSEWPLIFGTQLAVLIIVNAVSSGVAMGRYLRA